MSTTGAHVPGERAGGRPGPWVLWWAKRRSFALDVSLAAVSALECAFEGVTFAQKTGVAMTLGALFGLVVGAVLLVRRRWPAAVVLVAVAVGPAQMGFLLSLVGLYTLAASEAPRRVISALASMNGLGMLLVAFVSLRHDAQTSAGDAMSAPVVLLVATLIALGLTAPPVLLGLYVRARRRLVESLRDRADGLERELELLAEKALERAERARADERTRIAREMHDVVAHRVSLMVVHAAALKAVALKDPRQASQSAELIGDMGRQALTELRQMLGVLRTASTPVAAAPAAVPPGVLAPAAGAEPAAGEAATTRAGLAAGGEDLPRDVGVGPCLEQLAALVEESAAAGMGVELRVEGESRPCGPRVEATVYRVVQEALTNVHKHASGAEARVLLAYRDAEVAVLITNGPPDGSPAAALPSGGHGLLGMRERVTSHGGGFAAGPTPDGGFRVSAMIPLPSSA